MKSNFFGRNHTGGMATAILDEDGAERQLRPTNKGTAGLLRSPILLTRWYVSTNVHAQPRQTVKSALRIRAFLAIESHWLCCFIFTALALAGGHALAQASSAAPGSVVKTKCGSDMVVIPAGQFTMGFKGGPIDAKPEHVVKLAGFLMDQHEITQEVYEAVTGKNPSRVKNPKNPVEQVTWSAAARFCNARSLQEGLTPCYDTNTWECDFSATGYRLPTEAEWEYACRAGSTREYHFGDDPEKLKMHGWFEDNSGGRPHPVGQRKPNAWNLHDMAGNVWEWCNDNYDAKYYRESPSENPRGPKQSEKRVLRGGAWSASDGSCTSWIRNCDQMGLTDVCLTMDSNGFRCVRRP